MADYAELDKLKRRLDALRPIDAQMLRAIREKFRLEWTYHSNALEGNPLTLSETSFFIREGLTSKGRPLSAYLETTNHIEALEYLDSVVKDGRPITEHLVRLYHTMLFNKMDKISLGSGADRQETPIIGGQYKQQNNHVVRLDGKILQFTDVSLVPAEMEQLIRWYEETKAQLHPAELATQFHHRLVRIHPFLDGNGRVSRLLLNTILMRADYVPAIIPVEEKKQYLEALQSADDGDYEPLYGFIEAQVSKTLRLTLDIIEGREVFDLDDLTRMVQNITRKAKDIQRDLGPATEPPEKRAGITVAKIMQDVSRLVREHVQKTTIPGLNIAAADVPGMPVQVVPLFNQLIARFGPGRGPQTQLSISGPDRTIPSLIVFFTSASGRSQVGIGSALMIGRFNAANVEEIIAEGSDFRVLEGSIYYEDWDGKTINDFVIDILKMAYQKWEGEMDRRSALIAKEEAELGKYRKQQG